MVLVIGNNTTYIFLFLTNDKFLLKGIRYMKKVLFAMLFVLSSQVLSQEHKCMDVIKDLEGSKVKVGEEEVYLSIKGAKGEDQDTIDYWTKKAMIMPLITFRTEWDANDGMYMGVDLQILDAQTCKRLKTLTVWSD